MNLILMNFSSREFTHRVKSVSMAKFNAEEVSALQAGGNEVRHEIEYYFIANNVGIFIGNFLISLSNFFIFIS
jgi:hypothetical protein